MSGNAGMGAKQAREEQKKEKNNSLAGSASSAGPSWQ
jgi:hypothetical protein